MEYYPGARGYIQGGLSIVIIRNETELSLYHQQQWSSKYTESNKPYRLRRRYWTKRAFGVTGMWWCTLWCQIPIATTNIL